MRLARVGAGRSSRLVTGGFEAFAGPVIPSGS
jgi:hypothetical protein